MLLSNSTTIIGCSILVEVQFLVTSRLVRGTYVVDGRFFFRPVFWKMEGTEPIYNLAE